MTTMAMQWQDRFSQTTAKDGTRQHLESIVFPFASRFASEPQRKGKTLDATLITDEWHMFEDGSIFNSRKFHVVEMTAPFQSMTPKERFSALRDPKNFVNREDYVALSEAHYWRETDLAFAVSQAS